MHDRLPNESRLSGIDQAHEVVADRPHSDHGDRDPVAPFAKQALQGNMVALRANSLSGHFCANGNQIIVAYSALTGLSADCPVGAKGGGHANRCTLGQESCLPREVLTT